MSKDSLRGEPRKLRSRCFRPTGQVSADLLDARPGHHDLHFSTPLQLLEGLLSEVLVEERQRSRFVPVDQDTV